MRTPIGTPFVKDGKPLPFAPGIIADGQFYQTRLHLAAPRGKPIEGDIEKQTIATLDDIIRVDLLNQNIALSQIVYCEAALANGRDFDAFNAAYAGYLARYTGYSAKDLPARITTVGSFKTASAKIGLRVIAQSNSTKPVLNNPEWLRSGDRILFTSGMLAFDEENKFVGGDFAAQVGQVFENIESLCKRAGTEISRTVKLNAVVTNENDRAAFKEECKRRFDNALPGYEVQIDGLLVPQALFEMSAVIPVPSPR